MMTAEEVFDEIIASHERIKRSKMMGKPCIKAANNKVTAIFYKEEMVFKLPPEMLESVLAWEGAQLFDPMHGRPMKGWVQVPFQYANQWKELFVHALHYVEGL